MKYNSFCAANSGDGFVSLFDTILDEKKSKIYYIKGGPGSGKSTLLKKIASLTDDVELIYCSGDPGSLDGVVLPQQNAVVIDATSPHSHEPHYPGIGGNIIDLGEGWNPNLMDKQKIIDLCDHKSEIYNSCYALLKGAKSIHTGVFAPLIKEISFSKIKNAADKILRQNALWGKENDSANIHHRFFSGITSNGRITYSNSFASLGKNIILLDDRWMIGYLFLNILEAHLTENGIDHINCYHPLLGKEYLQHLIIPCANISIVSRDGIFPLNIDEENIIKKISMQSMLNKEFLNEHKNKLAFIKRILREIVDISCHKLDEARTIHLEIEQEYAKGTCFDATSHLKEKLIDNIFN